MRTFEDAAWQHFVGLGLQYFVAGRFAANAELVPVSGNLLHHAVEMLLKACLVSQVSMAELKRTGHDLTRLWQQAVEYWPEIQTPAHSTTIAELQRFERLRYPDSAIADGAAMTLTLAPSWDRAHFRSADTSVPQYYLALSGVDALFRELFKKADANPEVFVRGLSTAAQTAFGNANAHSF